MRPDPKIRDFASHHLTVVEPQASVAEASELMQEAGVRHLPVLEDGLVVGVLSWNDIHALQSLVAADLDAVRVQDAMCPDVEVVAPDTSLSAAAARMSERRIGSVVVLEEVLAGGLSRSELGGRRAAGPGLSRPRRRRGSARRSR
jgi:CBS domain-containing protein